MQKFLQSAGATSVGLHSLGYSHRDCTGICSFYDTKIYAYFSYFCF